jgi:hypothetical protein
MWFYKGKEFNPTEFDHENLVGFVYLVTNLQDGKMYVGKKNFWSTRRLQPLKGQKRKRVRKIESDWMNYFGSSEEVKMLVEQHGASNFHREILRLCESKGEMSYYEMKEQIDREVLFKDEYYNEFIGGKIHSKHVRKK